MQRLHAWNRDLGVDGRIILKHFLKNWDREAWTGLFWFRGGTVGAIVNAVMNLQVPNSGSFLTS
jgi:hypothetical protein